MQDVRVTNLVATAQLDVPIDLGRVARLAGATYNPESYHCAYMRDGGMRGKVSIFASGKMISIGTKSEIEAQRDLNHVARVLAGAGFQNKTRLAATVQNVVACGTLGGAVGLDALSARVPSMAYEPETFPGAIYRPLEFPATVLIFASGQLIIAGCQSVEMIQSVYSHVKGLVGSVSRCAQGLAGEQKRSRKPQT